MNTNTSSTPIPIIINKDTPLRIPTLLIPNIMRNMKYARGRQFRMERTPKKVKNTEKEVNMNTKTTISRRVIIASFMSLHRVVSTS